MFGHFFVVFAVLSYFIISLRKENRAGCLTFNVFCCYIARTVTFFLFIVSLSGLWSLIRAFSEHTCLLVVLRLGFEI